MTHAIPILLVTHRGLGEGMIAAAAAVLGERPEVDHLTNDGLSPDALGEKLDAWLDSHPGPSLILTDLGFGSCCQTARRVSRRREEVGIVAGINLAVLLAALRSREQKSLNAFLEHLGSRGRDSLELYLNGDRI